MTFLPQKTTKLSTKANMVYMGVDSNLFKSERNTENMIRFR